MGNDVVQVIFSFTIPDKRWLYLFSSKFTELDFGILSLLPLSKRRGNCLLQVKGINFSAFLHDFREYYKEDQYVILNEAPSSLLINVKMANPWFLQTIIDTDLILHYPIRIKSGAITIELIAERNKIDQMFTRFDKKNVNYTIIHIGHYSSSPILTPRQEIILQRLLEDGYYEIPRRKSLSTFAKEFKISPTSLSEMIRRISRNLARYYLVKKRKK